MKNVRYQCMINNFLNNTSCSYKHAHMYTFTVINKIRHTYVKLCDMRRVTFVPTGQIVVVFEKCEVALLVGLTGSEATPPQLR